MRQIKYVIKAYSGISNSDDFWEFLTLVLGVVGSIAILVILVSTFVLWEFPSGEVLRFGLISIGVMLLPALVKYTKDSK